MSPLVGPHNAPGGLYAGESWEEEMQGGGLIHQWLLGGWGVMIGEMWDLERLCEKSEELGRRTCFVSSVPLKVCLCQAMLILSSELISSFRYQVVLRVHRMLLQFSS
jgi:predicted transporter